jgi:hypothetical protein
VSDEILRLRDRLHKAEGDLRGLASHLGELERWRRQIDPIVAELREADRIAEAVAKRMKDERVGRLTSRQATVAIAAVCVAAGALLFDVLHGVGVL